MNRLVVGALLISCFGVHANAQETQGDDQQAAEVQQSAEEAEEEARQNEVVCRTEPVTGSRTRVNRTCMTRREWAILAEGTRRDVDLLERDANQSQALRDLRPPIGAGGF